MGLRAKSWGIPFAFWSLPGGAFSGSSPFNVGASRDLTIAPLRGTHGLSRISPPYQPLTKALLRSLLRAILFGT